ncbi:helix-turn-helix domain-containing protein [Streptomyces sp. NPDC005385]|uniref:PucR family transcriptional regulator n=1 Tax=Streptomyces sp. NPDC005385 TaxID=3157039 RepID=UPI0033ABE8E4
MAGSRTHSLHHRCSDRAKNLTPGSARGHTTFTRRGPRPSPLNPPDHDIRDLAVLSRALFDTPDEDTILRLAMAHIAAAGPYRAEAGYLTVGGDLRLSPTNGTPHTSALGRSVRELAGQDGPVTVPGRPWGRALGLRGLEGLRGYLVVTSRSRPTEAEQTLLATIAQQTAAALSVAFARRRQREDSLKLHRLRDEHAALQRQLISVAAELVYQRAVQSLVADVTASSGGEEAITRAIHRLTGLPALVEDRFGRLRSWTGPGCPDPYPEPDPVRQDEMLHTVACQAGPVRIKDRLVSLIRPHGEILGVLALVDTGNVADEHCVLALEHGAASLASELTHLRDLADVGRRLHRELVDDLLAGTDDASAYARSAAVGHDLHRDHYVVVMHWPNRPADESFAQTVGRTASALGMGSLLTRRSDHVVLVADGRPHDASALHEELSRETGTRSGMIGVSASCASPNEIPHHYQEAQRALEVRRHSRERYGTTFFDELGLYRILGPGNEYRELETFVQEWLGQLIDYDSLHHTAMVETLTRYFSCGGNYDETADSLSIHRSTLRYRLQRIREISGNDLANVEDRLNLQVATRIWKIVLGGHG